jgi:hypothetical protein
VCYKSESTRVGSETWIIWERGCWRNGVALIRASSTRLSNSGVCVWEPVCVHKEDILSISCSNSQTSIIKRFFSEPTTYCTEIFALHSQY